MCDDGDYENPDNYEEQEMDEIVKLDVQKVKTKRVVDHAELVEAIETARRECKDSYAQTYLRAIDLAATEYGQKGVGVQLLYCLNNMQTWRGPTARRVKLIFKKWAKILNKY